jgi:PHD/YefM family antitoxin component YafN of YafNO toxin-antitoxin module
MPTIKPVSDLQNYTEVLKMITSDSPVFLTRNGRSRYVIADIDEYEKTHAALKLMAELEKGRISGEQEGWSTLEEIKNEFDVSRA